MSRRSIQRRRAFVSRRLRANQVPRIRRFLDTVTRIPHARPTRQRDRDPLTPVAHAHGFSKAADHVGTSGEQVRTTVEICRWWGLRVRIEPDDDVAARQTDADVHCGRCGSRWIVYESYVGIACDVALTTSQVASVDMPSTTMISKIVVRVIVGGKRVEALANNPFFVEGRYDDGNRNGRWFEHADRFTVDSDVVAIITPPDRSSTRR